MAISTQRKLNELQELKKTDGTIQDEYNKINYQYQQMRNVYKISKQEYKMAQKELKMAEDTVKNESFVKKLNAKSIVKEAKKNLKLKEEKYLLDRQKYKLKLKELRTLRNEIRAQYKSFKQSAKFFQKVQEAEKMGITLPRYIKDEYNKQRSIDVSEKYSVDENGKRSYLTQPNTNCSKDVSSLIWEKNQQNVKDTLKNTVTQVKEHLNFKKDEGR